jgi:Holliday junction resolvase YEN1
MILPMQAPGEAEAELAAMNHAGHIDAVITNDVGTFLFGGLSVIRTSV